MDRFSGILLLLTIFTTISGNVVVDPPISSTVAPPQPVFQPQDPPARYVPQNYHYPDMYGSISPYESYLYPNGYHLESSPLASMTSLFSSAQGAYQVALRLFSRIGLFLVGGAALILISGLLTTIICSYTPVCNITFNGFGNIDREVVRAFMTPEKISTAAALVQDAIGKYQRLQRSTGGK